VPPGSLPQFQPVFLLLVLALLVLAGLGFVLTILAVLLPELRRRLWPPGGMTRPPVPVTAPLVSLGLMLVLGVLVKQSGVRLPPQLGAWRLPVRALASQLLILICILAGVFASRVSPDEATERLGLTRPRIHHFGSGVLAWICSLWAMVGVGAIVAAGYYALRGKMPSPQDTIVAIARTGTGPRLAMAAMAVIVAPILEEVLFRGILFRSLRSRLGFWGAGLVSAGLFAVVHMQPLQAARLAVLGMALAWVYERTGSLWAAITLHAVQNALAMLMVLSGGVTAAARSTGCLGLAADAGAGTAAGPLLIAVPLLLSVGFALSVCAALSPRMRDALWPDGGRPRSPGAAVAGSAFAIFLPSYLFLYSARAQLLPAIGSYRLPGSALMTQNLLLVAVTAAVWGSRIGPEEARLRLGLARPRARHLASGALAFVTAFWLLAAAGLAAAWLHRVATGEAPPPRKILELLPCADPGPRVIMICITILLSPVAEEVFFRGVLFSSLRARCGFWAAALMSSLVFAGLHLSPVHFPSLLVLGLVLAWLYERTGSLWPAMVLHALHNAWVMIVAYSGLV
jgi:membrane protease YdiL (CAAX protease family)